MNKSINKLPVEVINIIISYTYQFQPYELRKDIISYYLTKKIIKNIFVQRIYPLFYIKHLLFHIHGFLKGIPNIYSNCCDKLIEVSKRIYIQKNIYNLLTLYNYIYTKQKLNFIFNTYWGLLTIEERNQFIEIQINMDNSRMP